MATTYSKIQRNFWETDEAREMTPEEKYFWMYLQTNSNANTLGCYAFRMRKAIDETGYNKETIEKLLDRMQKLNRIISDKSTGEIYLMRWNEMNWNKQTQTMRAITADLKEIQSKMLKEMLKTMLLRNGIFAEKEMENRENTAFSDEKKGKKEQIGTIGNKTGGEGKGEGEGEGNGKKIFTSDSAEFFIFWKEYPNKKNKQTAMGRWDKLKVTADLYAKIMEGLKKAKESLEWAEKDGKYIPHPASWLNAGGWENEYRPKEESRKAAPRAAAAAGNDALAMRRRLREG